MYCSGSLIFRTCSAVAIILLLTAVWVKSPGTSYFLIVSIIISFIIFSLQFFHEREYWEIEVVFQTNFFLEISNKFSDIISEYIEFELERVLII